MRFVPSIHDELRDVQTYELDDGRRVTISAKIIRQHGLAQVMHDMGVGPDPSTIQRKPLYWDGRVAQRPQQIAPV